MNRIVFLLLVLTSTLHSQNNESNKIERYLEDQIYFGLSVITLTNVTDSIAQSGFSNNFGLGFIKDMPVNQKGSLAFGVGLGYGRSTYFQNIKITEQDNITQYTIAGDEVKKNKFSLHSLDIPLEIRFRTSTIDKYKFWRIYAGGKISYVFASNSKFKENGETIKIRKLTDINNLQYGLTLAVGYGTWNFNFYYGLSDLFSNANLNTVTPIEIRDFKIGLIFYIL